MAAMEYHRSFVPFTTIGRSIMSFRRDQIHAVDGGSEELKLESFQLQVANLFSHLDGDCAGDGEGLLSVAWIRELLDSFLICQEEFRIILFNNKADLARSPLNRLMADFSDRAVKALDICNAIRSGIDQVRQWQKLVEIVLAALDPSHQVFSEGHIRRAKKSLSQLAALMLDGKDTASARNRSFDKESGRDRFRTLSWSVSRTWSAARQIQAIGNNLSPPRGHEIAATNGLAGPVYTMSSVLLFVTWALVAAIPCQDRALQTHLSVPRSFPWAAPMISLHERIVEESKRKGKASIPLLKEIRQIENCTSRLMELMDRELCPLMKERGVEVRIVVKELAQVCGGMKDGLDLLERQVREVFHQIVRIRTEGLGSSTHNSD